MKKRAVFEEVAPGEAAKAPAAPGAAAAAKAGARRQVRNWLIALLLLVALMVLVGGLTRLTDSGLSITEWNLIMGAMPPLSEADWSKAFTAYQTTDEYRLQNSWMQLADFREIFWWEWAHRFLGRLIGLVWLLPLLYFAARRMIPRGWGLRLVMVGVLGGLQGAIGWWMVWSGLSARVDVAPYRLMTHLGIAFLIFALIFWFILKLGREEWALLQARRRRDKGLFSFAAVLSGVLFIQILAGALLAGTKGWAGWNTWPLMDGALIAPEAFAMTPFWANFFENQAMTQFVHRTIAALVVVAALLVALKARRGAHRGSRFWAQAALGGVLAQATLGVFTLLLAAPLEIAILHQLGGLLLLALVFRAKFEAAYPREESVRG
ncbi:MAG: COX15/CtaA family protein [Paracoccaceae bacterium]